MIRIGLWGMLYYILLIRSPQISSILIVQGTPLNSIIMPKCNRLYTQDPILIIKAPPFFVQVLAFPQGDLFSGAPFKGGLYGY